MRRSHNITFHEFSQILSIVNPNNIIPSLEQSIELEKLKLTVNQGDEEARNKIRDLTFILDFLRVRRFGG